MLNFKQILSLTDGFFLLFLAISGNFIAETLGCETQFFFSNNLFFKQAIVFLLLFFTINFTSKENLAPKESLIKATALWSFFLLFTKMSAEFTFIVLSLLILIFILEKQKEYITSIPSKDTSTNNTTEINNLIKYQKILISLSLMLVVIGFISYYLAKKREYKSSFRLGQFLFGVNKCKSLTSNKIVKY